MNNNFYRKSGNGKMPVGLIVGIMFALFGLFGAVPLLIPLIVPIVIIAIAINKGGKGNKSIDKFVNKFSESNNNGSFKVKKDTIVVDDELNTEGYKIQTDSEKRLESLKSLYNNGFMERDEYEEKRKKLTGGN